MLMISLTNTDKKELHTYAHKMLREALRLRCVEYSEATPITKNKMGKPSLAERPDIHYNLSHANGIVACIISDYECGIDCEGVREHRPNVIKRVFSDNEKAMYENAPDEEKDLLFFRLWTLKEAYVKAIGIGVSYPMDTVEFSFSGDEIISNMENCRFRQYIIDEGKYVVAVCEIIKQK
ncbi:4'-phosphopantetheinyl transferase family protein [Ruminococcus flavefaciens]|uniref:4'-phosphopantetheinyl transferase n=1 Tax=Ruminococcus flavefaciens TaxID=1265 RepID=A0A1M7JNR7_RUMFL|nr:4'-phosphopantetheinyl transferase superfamily protein [Ruminococcus flavefaciens]SHM54662.1 4'-phosphopantetheinyl transferase [Ruminococcus flavefaciens]